MEVEFTARQVKISKALRTQAEEGMERIARILGKTARASITFGAQKHLQIAELTIQARLQTIAAAGKADTPDVGAAPGDGARRESGAPLSRPADGEQAAAQGREDAYRAAGGPAQGPRRAARGRGRRADKPAPTRKKAAPSIAVHSFPSRTRSSSRTL